MTELPDPYLTKTERRMLKILRAAKVKRRVGRTLATDHAMGKLYHLKAVICLEFDFVDHRHATYEITPNGEVLLGGLETLRARELKLQAKDRQRMKSYAGEAFGMF